jgi:hypothetical protein
MYQVNGPRVEWNPATSRLRELTEEMPNASVTDEYERVAGLQDARTAASYMVVVDGFTGSADIEILQPRRRYDRPGPPDEHDAPVAGVKSLG